MSDSGSGKHGHHHFSFRRLWRKEDKAKQPSGGAKQRSGDQSNESPPTIQKPGPNVEETPKIEKVQEGLPSTAEYALNATKQTVDILKGIAELAPIPLVKNILELGLKIIETCEAINEVHSRIVILKNHIAGFLLVIAKVTKGPDPEPANRESMSQISDELKADLQQLKGCLDRITSQLDAIDAQKAIVTGFLSEPNLQAINNCREQFQAEISRFQTLRSLHAEQNLATIQQQLVKLYGITEGIAREVKETRQEVAEIKKEMTSGLRNLTSMLTKNANDESTILSRMPKSPNIFFGRDLVVQRLAEQLTCNGHNSSRICLLGPGGMGKTSTALAIMEHELVTQHFVQQCRFWVPCVSANSPSLFLATLFKQVGAEQKTGDRLTDIVASLKETSDPRIILLDNFETAWHPIEGSQSDIKLVLEALDTLRHVSILVTMRSDLNPFESLQWSCEKLTQIEPEDARKIYTTIDQSASNFPELDELVKTLGYLPYAITLMASRGKWSFSNPKQLLDEWNEEGTRMFSHTKEGIDHSISLSVDSKFVGSSPGALRLLQILSMLSSGVYREDLSIWADKWQSEAFVTLRDAALVLAREIKVRDTSKVHLFVLPVVQSYMKHKNRIPKEVEQHVYHSCYQFLAQHSITIQGPNDPNFVQHALAITSQEANIQALLTNIVKDALADANPPPYTSPTSPNPVTREQWLDALLSFCWYQRWTKPRPEISQHVVKLAKAIGNMQSEAFVLFCLGSIHFALSKFQDAVEAFTGAQLLFESLDDDIMALRSESMVVDSGAQFLSSPEAHELIYNYRAHWEERAEGNLSLKAWFLFRNGCFHLWASWLSCSNAILELETAQQLFSQLDPPCKFEMACSKYWIARSYAARGWDGDGEAALSAINSAVSIFQSLYGQGLVGMELADSYGVKASILKGLDRWDEELDTTLKVVLQSYQDMGDSRGIAEILVELAEIYVRRKDWSAATLAYEEAIRKCTGLEDHTSQFHVRNAQHNLRYIAHISAKGSLADSGEDNEEIRFWKPDRC